ncbi:hypothetical protein [Mucilaginibacter sp. CSA2-8R]|uniref:hypothetical protein n=1 Tax=Mucilaginibacter sp. CSA2-8R TaxID=3141542 RepID=UPI00315DB970
MTYSKSFNQKPQSVPALGKWMLLGGGIALATILFFVIGAGSGRAEWGAYWMVKPLLITPLAGVCGGAFAYRISRLGWNKALTLIIGLAGFLIALWMGIVLGLKGTMWH